ncbi:hypothetical protein F5Y15DRAFT_342331 [Xylariaceae sp. FL0016]|nr:hypothetical protein F5Y15DRAFT_342331 [Xylariaceae sp. FL0016]
MALEVSSGAGKMCRIRKVGQVYAMLDWYLFGYVWAVCFGFFPFLVEIVDTAAYRTLLTCLSFPKGYMVVYYVLEDSSSAAWDGVGAGRTKFGRSATSCRFVGSRSFSRYSCVLHYALIQNKGRFALATLSRSSSRFSWILRQLLSHSSSLSLCTPHFFPHTASDQPVPCIGDQ